MQTARRLPHNCFNGGISATHRCVSSSDFFAREPSAMRPAVTAWIALASLFQAIAGCSSLEIAPRAADVLRVSYSADPDTLNPLCAGDATSGFIQSFVYEPFARRNLAEPDEFIP